MNGIEFVVSLLKKLKTIEIIEQTNNKVIALIRNKETIEISIKNDDTYNLTGKGFNIFGLSNEDLVDTLIEKNFRRVKKEES